MSEESETIREEQAEIGSQLRLLRDEIEQNRAFAGNLGQIILDLDSRALKELNHARKTYSIPSFVSMIQIIQKKNYEKIAESILNEIKSGNGGVLISELMKLAA